MLNIYEDDITPSSMADTGNYYWTDMEEYS